MSAVSKVRTKPKPRWSLARLIGPSPADAAWISGLPAAGIMVSVGPPLLARAPSCRLVPGAMLLPLPVVRVNPVALPTALKLTLIDPGLRMSGPFVFVFPETTLLVIVTTLFAVVMVPGPVVRVMPPPPWPAVVLLAVLPETVQFWTRRLPVNEVTRMPPPELTAVLLAMVLLRTTSVFGVNPAGTLPPATPKK